MNWQEGLEKLVIIAEKANIEWWTTGKILLPLNGIDAEITDVDFYFNKNDLDVVCVAFQKYIVEPIVYKGSRFPTFRYNGMIYIHCEICMFSEPNADLDIPEPSHFGPYAAANLEVINWKGYKIKVPPIELYIKTLERWGKTEQVQYIRNALQRTK